MENVLSGTSKRKRIAYLREAINTVIDPDAFATDRESYDAAATRLLAAFDMWGYEGTLGDKTIFSNLGKRQLETLEFVYQSWLRKEQAP